MEAYYYVVFGVLVAVLAALEFSKSSKDRISTSAAFNAFKNNYLVVYSLMMGMWLPCFIFSYIFGLESLFFSVVYMYSLRLISPSLMCYVRFASIET